VSDNGSTQQEQGPKGFSKEMWTVLVLFAFLILSNGLFIIALIFLGPTQGFPVLIGYAISHITFFILMVLAACYYSRRKSEPEIS